MKLTSFLLVALFVALSQAICDSPNGVNVNNVCSCLSGYTGLNCDVNEVGTCPLPSVERLVTQSVAEFQSADASVSGNSFNFAITSKATQGRYFNSISLNNKANCSFPGTYYFKTFDTNMCEDVFQANFLIPTLVDECNFAVDSSTPGVLALSGNVHVEAVDQLGEFRGHPVTRTTKSQLALSLLLPTFINLTTVELNVFSPIQVLAGVTYQDYDPAVDTATIKITTSVQWPYTLSAPAITLKAFDRFSYDAVIEDLDCVSDANGAPCLQETTVTITSITSQGQCSLDGNYAATWSYSCRAGQSPCPGVGSSTANFTLEAGDLCGSVSIDAAIEGSLVPFSGPDLKTEKTVFVAGSTLYFKASLTTDVEVLSVSLVTLSISREGVDTTLFANRAPTFPSAQFQPLAPPTPSEYAFSIVASYGEDESFLFNSLIADGVFPFNIEAAFEVTYKTTFSKKRNTVQSKIALGSTVVLDAHAKAATDAAPGKPSNGKGLLGWIFA